MAALHDSSLNRRIFLAGLMSLAAAPRLYADEARIGKLIAESRSFPSLAKRIDVISAALLGKRYHANTLIGGPRVKEQFVVRDDAFDCVTYVEVVLAAARARDLPSFEAELRAIRYRNGAVDWRERNHDFEAWYERNIANEIGHALVVGSTVEVKKSIRSPAELGQRKYSIVATPRTVLLAHKDQLADGDVMGFVSLRPALDYYHCSFVIRRENGEILLRHASLSHGRVVNERLETFVTANRVRYVTLFRPQDKAA
ncbi:MAG: DUF1460 domain-containing protein [Pseudolabrys sp.]|nr:DUF1460 domain-containing protein [Pseudolabrys sp.]